MIATYELEPEPAFNIDAEQSLLGAMLLEQQAIEHCRAILVPREFYRDAHQVLCSAIYAMFDRNQPVDPVTLLQELKSHDKVDLIGGMAYLTALFTALPTAVNVEHYRAIVRDCYSKRHYTETLRNALVASYSLQLGDSVEIARASLAASLMDDAPKQASGLAPFREGLMAAHAAAEERSQQRGLAGMPTGFAALDRRLCGLKPGNLIVVGARSGMGKTSFAMALAEATARMKQTVCFFSLEMTHAEIAMRAACTRGMVDSRDVNAGDLDADGWVHFTEGVQKLYTYPILVDDSSDVTLLDIHAKVRRAASQNNVGLVIVDFLQLLRVNKRTENRTQEVAAIARGLKSLAKDAGVPVVALSQLSREVDKRENKRPVLADLMESGGIEAAADLVMFLYRESYYAQKSGLHDGQTSSAEKSTASQPCEVIIAKHRNGADGIVQLAFIPAYTLFHDPNWVGGPRGSN